MESDLGERIVLALNQMGLKQVDLVRASEATSGYVSAVCRGAKKASIELCIGMVHLGVSGTWLLTGEGSMRRGTVAAPAASPRPLGPSNLEVELGPDLAAELRRLCLVDADGRLRLRVLAYVQGVADAAPAPRTLAAG